MLWLWARGMKVYKGVYLRRLKKEILSDPMAFGKRTSEAGYLAVRKGPFIVRYQLVSDPKTHEPVVQMSVKERLSLPERILAQIGSFLRFVSYWLLFLWRRLGLQRTFRRLQAVFRHKRREAEREVR